MEKTTIDKFDRKSFVYFSARDGYQLRTERKSWAEPDPVSRRLKILEKVGVITGYSALLDEAALGFGVTVFVSVRLEKE